MIRQILKEYNIKGGKMDQHFLIDIPTLNSIVEAASLEPADIVLEIGGGIGNLSERIAPRVQKLIIIELDPQMVHVLKSRLSVFENVEIISGNVMDIELSSLPFNKIVANLPYSISSDVTLKLLQSEFETAVLMYQYEFAQRVTADAGNKDYGRLSVHVQSKSEADMILKVPKQFFEPAPKVDSAVIRLTPKTEFYSISDERFFFSVTKALFSQRRKKIKNTLLGSALKSEMPALKEALEALSPMPFISAAVKENPKAAGFLSPELFDKTIGDVLSMRAEELSPGDMAHFSEILFRRKTKAD